MKTLQELRDGVAYVEAVMREMVATAETRDDSALTTEESTEFDAGMAYVEATREEIAEREKRENFIAKLGDGKTREAAPKGAPNVILDVNPLEELDQARSVKDVRELAKRSIGEWDNWAEADHQDQATKVALGRAAQDPSGSLARRSIVTLTDDYLSAFGKMFSGRGELMSDAERQAVVAAERAVNVYGGTATEGANMVPTHLDPTVVWTAAQSANPWRSISKQVSLGSPGPNIWNGITSAGVSTVWGAEATQMAEQAIAFDPEAIPVERAEAYTQWTFEAEEDIAGLTATLLEAFGEARDEFEATNFATGTGSSQNTGVVTAIRAAAGSLFETAGIGTYVVGDLYALTADLPRRYRNNSTFIMDLDIINLTRQFGGDQDHAFLTQLADGSPSRLLNRPLIDAEGLDTTVSAGNEIVLYGDFSRFVIVDKVGLNFENVPTVFGANNRPTAQRGMLLWWRFGSDVIVTDAFRALQVRTS